ncbi:MAG: hypothetical protein ACE5JJ_01590 [Nitrospinota bacterium]
MANADLVKMAYGRLLGLRDNIPKNLVHINYVNEFHDIISDLESLGFQLDKFRVPNVATREFRGQYCEGDFLRMKVDGLLNLFHVSEDRQKIGFLDRGSSG